MQKRCCGQQLVEAFRPTNQKIIDNKKRIGNNQDDELKKNKRRARKNKRRIEERIEEELKKE